jgi:hypothetical protein
MASPDINYYTFRRRGRCLAEIDRMTSGPRPDVGIGFACNRAVAISDFTSGRSSTAADSSLMNRV